MSGIAAVGLTAFVLCLITTPLIRNIFTHAKLLDHPDNGRKLHLHAMPRVGGIAIVISYLGALGLALLVAPHPVLFPIRHGAFMLSLLPATGLIFLTGLIDDLITLKPWQKLLGQVFAAGLAVSLGATLTMHHGPSWLATGISFVWLLACTNAFNLIDGIDGLAAGVALFAASATLLAAALNGDLGLALATASLAGCLLGFLRYNFHPASIFLGDCGSLTIGFLLGCFALCWSRHTGTLLGIGAPLIALSLPLLDVALALGRRFLRSAPLFEGDRHHIHHKVLARSMSTRKAVFILYGVCCAAATLAILLNVSPHRFKWAILLLFCSLALAGIRSLRYIEFAAALKSLSRRSMLRLVKEEIYVQELESALAGADTVESIWDVACIACEDLQIASLSMHLHDRRFYLEVEAAPDDLAWAITIPLGAHGALSLSRIRTAGDSRLLLSVLDCLQASIAQKDFVEVDSLLGSPTFSYRGAA